MTNKDRIEAEAIIEQQAAEVERLRESLAEECALRVKDGEELERLRAQVAPARAMVEAASRDWPSSPVTRRAVIEAADKLRTALDSAGPEQQATNAIIAKHFGADVAGAIKAQDVVREVLAAGVKCRLTPEQAEPSSTVGDAVKFACWDADNGLETFDTHAEALEYATETLNHYRDAAKFDGEWPGDVDSMWVGAIHITHKPTTTAPDDEGGVDYKLQPVAAQPAAQAEPVPCANCNGRGYSDAWTMDGEYNPTHCNECDGGRKPPLSNPPAQHKEHP